MSGTAENANKSGVGDQVLSLPSGGGAVQGTGGTFSAQTQTGAGRFSIPIETPDGRNGMEPSLGLAYSTGNGDGPFGMGWTLGPGAVSRKTSTGVPVYDDDEDTFTLPGADDLVAVDERTTAAGVTVTRYRPRVEGDFRRIEHHVGENTDHWIVEEPGGRVRRYGTPGRARADPAVIADPDDRSKVFRWHLTETEDQFGNRVEYEYTRDTGETPARHWDQLYLERIRYVNYPDDDGDPAFLVSVAFEYEDRPVAFSRYRSGFEIRTRYRCSSIRVLTHADVDRTVRRYDLTYRDDAPDESPPPNGVSQLVRVDVIGIDDDETQRLPPVEFDYSGFTPQAREFEAVDGPLPRRSLAAPELELADLSGDGLPDIVEIDGTVRYWRNLGDGRFDAPRPMAESPSGISLGDSNAQLLDADGDGRIDLATFDTPRSGYFPHDRDGGWAEESFQPYDRFPALDFDARNVKLVDLDGDGVTDALRSGSSLECFFQDPDGGWTDAKTAPGSLDGPGRVDFADPRMRLADLSGDGLQDIVLIDDGHVAYWPNRGHGEFGGPVPMRNPPELPRNRDPNRVLLGDVDGDGLTDIVYVEDDRVHLWVNRCGNEWSDPFVIEGTPSVTDTAAIRLVDLEGRSIGGLLYSGGGRVGDEDMYFLSFIGEQKPYLMTETENNMGARTRIEYASSTEFLLQDRREGAGWKTSLPRPTWVVAGVRKTDAVSGGQLTTRFDYHHGYWDGAEREFRGFGLVEQRDSETFAVHNGTDGRDDDPSVRAVPEDQFSPPTLTKTWFHLGPVGHEHGDWRELDYGDEYWPGDRQSLARPAATTALLDALPRRDRRDAIRSLQGNRLRTEVYALDGDDREDRPYTVSEAAFGIRKEADGSEAADRDVFFPYERATRRTRWERGDDPMTSFTFTDDYDEFGQERALTEIACPRGWTETERSTEYLITRTERTYARRHDDDRYIVDRPATESTYEITVEAPRTVSEIREAVRAGTADRALIDETLHYYDGAPYEGRAIGDLGDYGALVRTESLVLTDEVLAAAYPPDDSIPGAAGAPTYLATEDPEWGPEYPATFTDRIESAESIARDRSESVRAGYIYRDEPGVATGHYAVEFQREYDVHAGDGWGLVSATRDVYGNESTVTYDEYDLFPVRIEGPTGLVTRAEHDYRAMKPRRVTNPNGTRVENGYTPLGLVDWKANLGRAGEREGDTPEHPTKRFEYHLRAHEAGPDGTIEPAYVHVIERTRHRSDVARDDDGDRPAGEESDGADGDEAPSSTAERSEHPERFIEKRLYSDGFGRVVQTRTQAEDVVVGEDDTFGDGALPPEQSGATPGPVPVQAVGADETRVRVSGWTTYDNKGNVVEAFEPFFHRGPTEDCWAYLSRNEAAVERPDAFGRKQVMEYDALGRETRTVHPDGSAERTVRGIPYALDDPTAFAPTPWESYSYDSNDNAGRTHGADAKAYRHHWNTPTSTRVDPLGRTVERIERNRAAGDDGPGPIETRSTQKTYDIKGNVVSVVGPLGREVRSAVYDLRGNELRSESLDAGVERVVLDGAGTEVERRDGTGAVVLQRYDPLGRPTHRWSATEDPDGPLGLTRRVVYGDAADGLSTSDARDRNLLGAVHKRYDQGGRLRFEQYDFKGNVVRKNRTVLTDDAVRGPPVDWEPGPDGTLGDREDALLGARSFRTATEYDAQDRVTMTRYPKDEEARRRHPDAPDVGRNELRLDYARSGALLGIELATGVGTPDQDVETYVEHIGYSATGDRTFVAYGNDVMTRRAYDDETGRLAREVLQPFDRNADGSFVPAGDGTPLRDLGYEYDLAGNIRTISDRSPNAGVADSTRGRDALDREFEYDALGRLTRATGREAETLPSPRPWGDTRQTVDPDAYSLPDIGRANAPDHTTKYTERYAYDPAGNLTELRHTNGDPSRSWTRTFGMGGFSPAAWDPTGANWTGTPTNRVTHVADGRQPAGPTHEYDAVGNLERERNSEYSWDADSRLLTYRETAADGTPSVTASYAYDAAGNRVKKVVDKDARTEVTVYIDGVFEYRRHDANGETTENNTLHVMDDTSRIALVRIGGPLETGDTTPPIRYHFGDHLDSTTLVVDGDGDWVNYEEYSPYGQTVVGGFDRKRYRYSGKERDEESGLYYYGSRYYAPWVCRFRSVDPQVDATPTRSPYALSANNPMVYRDREGENPNKVIEEGRKYLGTPYQQEGKRDPKNRSEEAVSTMDCSEFVSRVYADAYGMLDRKHATSTLLSHFEESPKWKRVKGEPKKGDVFISRHTKKQYDKQGNLIRNDQGDVVTETSGHTGIVVKNTGDSLVIMHASGWDTSKKWFDKRTKRIELTESESAYKNEGAAKSERYTVPVTIHSDDVRADWQEDRKEKGTVSFTGRFYRPTRHTYYDEADLRRLNNLRNKHQALKKRANAIEKKLEDYTNRGPGEAPVPPSHKLETLEKYEKVRSKMADVQDRIESIKSNVKAAGKGGSVVDQAVENARGAAASEKARMDYLEAKYPKGRP